MKHTWKREPLSHRQAWARRVELVRAALGGPACPTPTALGSRQLGPVLSDIVDVTDRSHVWLVLATLTGILPDTTTVIETSRYCEFDGGRSLWRAVAEHTTDESAAWNVRVESKSILLDVMHTSQSDLRTGIQRVVRQTVRRWVRDHGRAASTVAWTNHFQSMRELTPLEQHRVLGADHDVEPLDEVSGKRSEPVVVVPWHTTYLLPELGVELPRTSRLAALSEFMPGRTGVIGYDCVPITSAETTVVGHPDVFARHLVAVRNFDVVSTISNAAGHEYEGWRDSLTAIGVTGPQIVPVSLPVEIPEPEPDATADADVQFRAGRLPLVLVVGSHEPRKNHLAVLHAAELLWRDGLEFSLSFVGGTSWGDQAFSKRISELQQLGRPVDTTSKLPDRLLWPAYRLARLTVFPSLNEGFGLPLAESLAAGTPAVTSNFGSMREIAEGGGALMIDPHDDDALADAMRTLLTDDAVHARLTAEAQARAAHPRTWDDYSAEVWDALVGGPTPPDEITRSSMEARS